MKKAFHFSVWYKDEDCVFFFIIVSARNSAFHSHEGTIFLRRLVFDEEVAMFFNVNWCFNEEFLLVTHFQCFCRSWRGRGRRRVLFCVILSAVVIFLGNTLVLHVYWRGGIGISECFFSPAFLHEKEEIFLANSWHSAFFSWQCK